MRKQIQELSNDTLRDYAAKADKKKDRNKGASKAYKKHPLKEDVEENRSKSYFQFRDELNELSAKTVKSYRKKAASQLDKDWDDTKKGQSGLTQNKVVNRIRGVYNADKRIAKESNQLDELSKKTLRQYGSKAIRSMLTAKSAGDDKKVKKRSVGVNQASSKIYPSQYKNSPLKSKIHATEDTQLDELSTNTLGSYAKKAHNHADIAARMVNKSGDEMDKIADKRSKGSALAVRKLGKKAGTPGDATKTSNLIKVGVNQAKKWKSNPYNSTDANKKYNNAQRGIGRVWDKADKKGK